LFIIINLSAANLIIFVKFALLRLSKATLRYKVKIYKYGK
jgi:hypothetical protein